MRRKMMRMDRAVDTLEKVISLEILSILLKDHSTKTNIIWGTDDYQHIGEGYRSSDTIEVALISGKREGIIKIRKNKERSEQENRSKEKAEVFTPLWVCNVQNNLVDDAWFGKSKSRFNTETQKGWITNYEPMAFSGEEGKTWEDYVRAIRLEISCGEAPYLTSRYDTVSGEYIQVEDRIGLFDRKLRVITENVSDKDAWIEWTRIAAKSIYGYDYQGDNVLLARRNVLYAAIESYYNVFSDPLEIEIIKEIAEIISWNIWQMDGLKFVVPKSCRPIWEPALTFEALIEGNSTVECPGCLTGIHTEHTGVYCKIMDWEEKKEVRYIDIVKGAINGR